VPSTGEALAMDGRVIEGLPNAMYRVELDDQARTRITAHVSGQSGLLRLLPGDAVRVELMPYDMTRGRIVGKR